MAECLPATATESLDDKAKAQGGGKIRTKRPNQTKVVCIKKQSLQKQGYRDLICPGMIMAECLPATATELLDDKAKAQGGGKIRTKRPNQTKVVCVKKQSLQKQGYRDLKHWLTNPNHVYIGRNMTFYVPAAVGSKWKNSFSVKKYGRTKCIDLYKEYIQNDKKKYDGKTLLESLDELRGKTLGCWCSPERCHGDALIELLTLNKAIGKEHNDVYSIVELSGDECCTSSKIK